MKNILLVHNYYQIPGGEDTVVKNEAQLLEKHGHKVVLYRRSNDEIKHMNFFQKMLLPLTAVFSLKTYREVKKVIKEEAIDIMHVHNTLTMVSPSVFWAAFSCKIPVVQTLHNFRMICPNGLFFNNGQVCEKCLEGNVFQAVYNKCYRNSKVQSLIVVISAYIHRYIGTYKNVNFICLTEFNRQKLFQKNKEIKFVKEEKVFVKPNFMDFDSSFVVSSERKRQGVYVGRIEEIKGIVPLLEAWKDIKNVDLILCGKGPLEHWLKKYCVDNHMDNVKMLGYVEHDKIMNIIAESQFLILPSLLYEGFPMTIVESFACGTPVLCSDIGNLGSLVQNGKNGYKFKVGDVVDIKTKIEVAISRKDKLRMYNCCREVFEAYYSEEKNYSILMDIYCKLK